MKISRAELDPSIHFARKCDNSNKGMNEGYYDSGCYYKTEADLLEANRKNNPNYTLSDWENDCEEHFDDCYWTEWELDECDEVYTIDGELIEVVD